jgi:hypothetical protein
MIGGAEAVNAGADDEIFDMRGNHARPAGRGENCLLNQFSNWSKYLAVSAAE